MSIYIAAMVIPCKYNCCIFWQAFGCCTLQTLVEIAIFWSNYTTCNIYSTWRKQQHGLHLRKFVHTNLPRWGLNLNLWDHKPACYQWSHPCLCLLIVICYFLCIIESFLLHRIKMSFFEKSKIGVLGKTWYFFAPFLLFFIALSNP